MTRREQARDRRQRIAEERRREAVHEGAQHDRAGRPGQAAGDRHQHDEEMLGRALAARAQAAGHRGRLGHRDGRL
ncbi:MAG: hypothetical protein M5U32_05340 [Myxococcota bacterium]|nr:hypothetical protein [Myxococcota bacterium]